MFTALTTQVSVVDRPMTQQGLGGMKTGIKGNIFFKLNACLLLVFNPFQTNGISINLHKIRSGWSIVYIEGSQAIIAPKNIVFFSLKIPHYVAFQWVFTVCHSICLRVSSPKRVNSFAANVAVWRPTPECQCRHNATWTCGLFQ